MADWNTKKMKASLSKLGDVYVTKPGGDFDTDNLLVQLGINADIL